MRSQRRAPTDSDLGRSGDPPAAIDEANGCVGVGYVSSDLLGEPDAVVQYIVGEALWPLECAIGEFFEAIWLAT